MSNKTYDLLKKVALIYLPALGTLYFALCGIWGLPNGEAVIGTIAAIDTCIGTILTASSESYNKVVTKLESAPNSVSVHTEDGGKNG